MRSATRRQWRFWRDDYRCTRPPVSCRGCGRHYPQHVSAAVMIFSGYTLVSCSNCSKPKPKKPLRSVAELIQRQRLKQKRPIFPYPKVYKRTYRDVACRYLQRYGGRTHREQTAIDDFEVYLVNPNNVAIATISSLDRFPKPIEDVVCDDIPF